MRRHSSPASRDEPTARVELAERAIGAALPPGNQPAGSPAPRTWCRHERNLRNEPGFAEERGGRATGRRERSLRNAAVEHGPPARDVLAGFVGAEEPGDGVSGNCGANHRTQPRPRGTKWRSWAAPTNEVVAWRNSRSEPS